MAGLLKAIRKKLEDFGNRGTWAFRVLIYTAVLIQVNACATLDLSDSRCPRFTEQLHGAIVFLLALLQARR